MKLKPVNQWVANAVERLGWGGQSLLAKRLTKMLHREIDRAAVNKMTKGTREVAADEMLAIEAISGVPIPSPSRIGFDPSVAESIDALLMGVSAEIKNDVRRFAMFRLSTSGAPAEEQRPPLALQRKKTKKEKDHEGNVIRSTSSRSSRRSGGRTSRPGRIDRALQQ